jgi:hypothetical protein
MRPLNLVGDLVKDLAYAARTLGKVPTFATTVIFGASTAIFSVVNAVLLSHISLLWIAVFAFTYLKRHGSE